LRRRMYVIYNIYKLDILIFFVYLKSEILLVYKTE
jgi:hypothetical protein